MKISVENLGTIKKGEISLDKDLTIFTGENNSGKSYMSYLCYGVLEFMYFTYKNKQVIKEITKIYSEAFSIVRKEHLIINLKTITEECYKFILSVFNDEDINILFTVFGQNFDNKPKFNVDVTDVEQKFMHLDYIFLKEKYPKEIIVNNKAYQIFFDDELLIITSEILEDDVSLEITQFIVSEIFNNGGKINKYFIPAERTAINMFYLNIVRQEAINKNKKPLAPLAISDYIFFAYDFHEHILNPPTEFADLATELENLLGGGVGVSGFGDLQFQPTKQENQIPLYLSSSLVKSWSGVVIYLRHLAQKNDVLMIDEPEINLHPKSQVLIARFLAKMVNRGIKIVVSTHSDYILRELSTLIILNNEFEGKEKLLNRYPEYQNQGLAAEKVAVYNFANHTIENIEITNKGIETASIDTVISHQNETSDAMYYTYLDSLPSEE